MSASTSASLSAFETLPNELANAILDHLKLSSELVQYMEAMSSLRRLSRTVASGAFGITAENALRTRRVVTAKNAKLLLRDPQDAVEETFEESMKWRRRLQDRTKNVLRITIQSLPQTLSGSHGHFGTREPVLAFRNLESLCILQEALDNRSSLLKSILTQTKGLQVCITRPSLSGLEDNSGEADTAAPISGLPTGSRLTLHVSALGTKRQPELLIGRTAFRNLRIIGRPGFEEEEGEPGSSISDLAFACAPTLQAHIAGTVELVDPQHLVHTARYPGCSPEKVIQSALFDTTIQSDDGESYNVYTDMTSLYQQENLDLPEPWDTVPNDHMARLTFSYSRGNDADRRQEAKPCVVCDSLEGC